MHSKDKYSEVIDHCNKLFLSGKKSFALREVYSHLENFPNNTQLINTAAIFEAKTGNLTTSYNLFVKLNKLAPENNTYKYNLANILVNLDRYEESEEILRNLANHNKQNYKFQRDYGVILLKLNRPQDAEKYLLRAKEINDKDQSISFVLATTYLKLGKLSKGWALYESRFSQEKYKNNLEIASEKIAHGLIPKYKGENLAYKTLLIHHEQGYGDFIQFMRYIHTLRKKFIGIKIILVTRKALYRLLVNSNIADSVYHHNEAEKVDHLKIDFWDFIMSIPRYFEIDYKSVVFSEPYITHKTDSNSTRKIKLSKIKPNVGIIYKGSNTHENDYNRSIHLKEDIEKLFSLTSLNYIYLGMDKPPEISKIQEIEINFIEDFIDDFEDTYSILKDLDLVISVDTSVAHLAGAMGKICWLILPYSADWRWGVDKTSSPWYPSIKIYRQVNRGNWGKLVDDLNHDLKEFLNI